MIELETIVLFYNKWTGFESRVVRQFFRQATTEEIQNLKPGDTIWRDRDPIHPNGKVYGFVKKRVERVEGEKIFLSHGGLATFDSQIFLVDDELALAEMIAADPLITDIVGEAGRTAYQLVQALGPYGALAIARSLRASNAEGD